MVMDAGTDAHIAWQSGPHALSSDPASSSMAGPYPGAPQQSADQNTNEFVSWFRDIRADDLGKAAVQHKPLNKGPHAQASLAKSFVDSDPGMGPRIMCPATVHKPHTPLTIDDITGSRPVRRDVFPRARDTDPNQPVYKLASCPVTEDTPAHSSTRPVNDVSDIQGATSRPMPAFQPQVQNLCLDVTDIEGTYAAWKPQFRALGNGIPTDKRFNVSDINTTAKRRLQAHRPDDPWVSGTSTTPQSKPRPASAYPASPATSAVVVAAHQHEYTGLPYFQMARARDANADEAGQQHQDSNATSATASPAVTDALAAELQHSITHVNQQFAKARRQQQLLHTDVAHSIRVAISDEAVQARKLATATVNSLQVSRDQVEVLWNALKTIDREGSGKVQLPELDAAFKKADVQVSPSQLQALAYGLKDGVGLLSYADFVKTLLWRSKHAQPGAAGPAGKPRPFSAVASLASTRTRPSSARLQAPSAGRTDSLTPVPSGQPAVQQPAVQPPAALLTAAEPVVLQRSSTAAGHAAPQPTWSSVPAHPDTSPGDGCTTPTPATCVQGAAVTSTQVAAAPKSQANVHPHEASSPAACPTHSSPGVLPPGVTLLGPEGAKYYIYKGKTYWFGGNDSAGELAAAAGAYKPTHDQSYNASLRNIMRGLGDGGPLSADGCVGHSIRDMPTTSILLKTGKLTGEQLSTQLDMKHLRTQHTEQNMRARPASATAQQPMLPAPQSGASLGASLRSVVGAGLGTGKQTPDIGQLSGWPQRTRASSARPAGKPTNTLRDTARAAVVTSFTSVANAGPGAKAMGRHDHALLRDEIQSIRLLA